jgi:quercetin dioxygenase-like cupin family protein
MRFGFVAAGAAVLLGLAGAAAVAADDMHATTSAAGVAWGSAPPVLPKGAMLAVMAGDPSKPGFVSLRLKMPAGYVIPSHTHPTDEHVTVLSGTMAFGMGDKVDAEAATTVKAGGYFIAMTGMHHFAVARTAAVVQVDMEGPFAITYVNPADDPTKK